MTTTIWLTIIGLVITASGILHRTLISRKQATIDTLTEQNSWLEKQLAVAKENSPDILAERLAKRVTLLQDEISRLSEDQNRNEKLIAEKESELSETKALINDLTVQIASAQGTIDDLGYFKEQFGCPVCGSELTILAGEEEEFRAYACGNTSGPNGDSPCPHDPKFPKFEDYELSFKQVAGNAFFCKAKPKNKNASRLTLKTQFGRTKDEAQHKLLEHYQGFLPQKTESKM